VTILDGAPENREEFIAKYAKHRKERLCTGLIAFIRHNLTNYDEILIYAMKRWPRISLRRDCSDILRPRVTEVAWQYLRDIDAADLYEPNTRRLIVPPKIVLPVNRKLC
jgi:hypothetical protein